MRVRMLAEISGNDRKYMLGEVCDLQDDHATRWVSAGFAEAITDEASDTPAETPDEPVEAAALADAPERATLPRAQKRGAA